MTGAPPRLAERLLRRTLPRGDAGETILGDLLEGWGDRGGSGAAARWYWRQALSLSARYWWRRPRIEYPAQTRNGRRTMFFDNLMQDVRYAVRSYAKTPSFSLAILATLALGIGASTAIFSMVNGILFRPLPLPAPDRILFATEVSARSRGNSISVSWPNYLDWRARARSFEGLADTREEPLTLTGFDEARRIRARRVTGNFFSVIGVAPALGRSLSDDDDHASAAPAAILTDGFWKTAFGGDRSILGRMMTLDGTAYAIVGVMPAGFEYLRPYDAFVSIGPVAGSRQLLSRGNHNGYNAIGRLKPGVTVEAAGRELAAIAAALEHEYPATNTAVTTHVELLSNRLVTNVRLTLLALFGAVGCLLLIACVNVASLLIARGAARQHELSVRAALGGGRGRLATQLLIESTLVCAVGGMLGVGFATWLLRALVAAAPEGTPRIATVGIDGAALAFAFAAAAVCGVIFGAFPAFQAAGTDGQQALIRGRAAGFAVRSHRLRRGLIVVETALAIVLLVGAGLMIRTVQGLVGVDVGFRGDHVLTTRFTLSGRQWTPETRVPFYRDLLEQVRAVPGVTNAALTYSLPIDGSQWNSIFIVADKPVPERAQLPTAAFNPVTDAIFDTMGIRLLRGRTFTSGDTATSAQVIVINETLAKSLWPDEDAVGKRLKQGWPEDQSPWKEVVGVVADVKLNGVTVDTPSEVYLPATQESSNYMTLVIRSAIESHSVLPGVEAAAHVINKDLPLYQTRTMDQVLAGSIAQQRMSVLVLVTFAAVALTLASIGLYGVVSHGVTERTHEIGVRMALGAEQRHVLGLLVRQGLTMSALGTALGVTGAIALSRWIEGMLFGVTGTDPMTMIAVVATLMAVALVACYVPAWRATKMDPTTALRSE
jgi:putative ABC transport system permease protein